MTTQTTQKQQTYDVDYFINKFSAILEDQWLVGDFENANGQKCALGHCGWKHGRQPDNELKEGNCLRKILELKGVEDVSMLNDGRNPNYQQPTPKQRILAALHDVKKLQTNSQL